MVRCAHVTSTFNERLHLRSVPAKAVPETSWQRGPSVPCVEQRSKPQSQLSSKSILLSSLVSEEPFHVMRHNGSAGAWHAGDSRATAKKMHMAMVMKALKFQAL